MPTQMNTGTDATLNEAILSRLLANPDTKVLTQALYDKLVAGATMLSGASVPDDVTDGIDGDVYFDTTNFTFYGPKAAGSWGAATSIVGPAGADGADGINGIDGVDGAQGPAGADGADGAQGIQGIQGPAGNDGADGAQGPAGADGTNGTNGLDGADGADGQGVPIGGTTGQVLKKNSNGDFDTIWQDESGGGSGTVDVVSNVVADRILGRVTAGSGDSEELTAAQVRALLNVEDGATADMTGLEIQVLYEAVAGAWNATKDGNLDSLIDLINFDPDDKVNVSALEFFIDNRAGVKDATRISSDPTVAVMWRANPENLPPDELGEFDGWAGYAAGAMFMRTEGANTDLDAGDMGGVVVASAALTFTIREDVNHNIPRSQGFMHGFALFADGGAITIASEAGVTVNGNLTVPQGSWAWVYSSAVDVFGVA